MATTEKLEIRSNEDAERVLGDIVRQIREIKDGNQAAIADVEGLKGNLDAIARKINSRNAPETPEDRDCARSVVALDQHASALRDAEMRPGRDFLVSNGRALALTTIETKTMRIPGLLDSHDATPAQRRLQVLITQRNLIRSRMTSDRLRRSSATPKLDQAIVEEIRRFPVQSVREAFSDEVLRIFADVSGSGGETIFDYDMPELERKIDAERSVASLFPVMNVSSSTFVWPYQTRRLRPYKGGVAIANNPPSFNISTMGTADRTYTLSKMVIRAQIDDDAAEDSFLDAMSLHMDEMSESYLYGEEDAIINGDTAATHQDTALGSWDPRGMWGSDDAGLLDHRRCFLGLRARAFDASNVTDLSTTELVTALRSARATLKAPYGLMSAVHLVSYEAFLNQLQDEEDFKTLEKFGALASRLAGGIDGPLPNQVGEIDGVPVVMSWFLTADLPSTGLYTTAGATSSALTLSRDRFLLAQRRTRRLETARDITRQVTDAVLSARVLFTQRPSDSASDKLVHCVRNIT